ncbi:MAG: zinc dependent phospholipase C family protein [Anaerolineales bacterium]|jgi:hypothetical protein
MQKIYHLEICKRALADQFSTKALDVIIKANIGQDKIRYQFKHPQFHFDSNAFEASFNYIEEQRQIILEINHSFNKLQASWQAFGRLTHVVQDFYAHSNYIQLWLNTFQFQEKPTPQQVVAMDMDILRDPQLHSGNVYFLDWLAFIPGFYAIAHYLTPTDSHTHMNLDHPNRGMQFSYAIEAAVKRTVFEYNQTTALLDSEKLRLFKDI